MSTEDLYDRNPCIEQKHQVQLFLRTRFWSMILIIPCLILVAESNSKLCKAQVVPLATNADNQKYMVH